MLKFWKSPRLSPNPSTATSSTSPREQTPPSVNLNSNSASSRPAKATQDTPDAQIGLGLSMPGVEGWAERGEREKDERLENHSGGLAVPQSSERVHVKSGRRSSASQVAFVEEKGRGETSKTGGRLAALAGEGGRGGSRSEHRISHEQSTVAHHHPQDGTRAVSPMSFSPSTASTFRNPYASMSALSERDPNQIYG